MPMFESKAVFEDMLPAWHAGSLIESYKQVPTDTGLGKV
jgi:hypothetical protein